MALFGRKKPGDGEANGQGTEKGEAAFEPQPEKARVWFEHAKVAADAYNYAYALHCYANGIRLDPETMSAHEAMWNAAVQYFNRGGKPAASKEIKKVEGPSIVDRFAAAEFAWMKDLNNLTLALKMMDAAIKANQLEFGNWIAPRMLNMLRKAKKPSKSNFLKAMEHFRVVGAWDAALAAGQSALALDPTDGTLDGELKSISAQRAMDQGGYEEAAREEGGFRSFVKDLDKQRELAEEESIGGGTTDERNLARARKAYETAPADVDSLNRYAQLLKAAGGDENELAAHETYMKGFAATGEYRFRMNAGDIDISRARRALRAAEDAAEANPDDTELRARVDDARQALLDLRVSEFGERAKRYPTDRFVRYELGRIEYELGRFEDAMASFQTAKDEPKLRVAAGHMLGLCFEKEGWHQEASDEFREALDAIDTTTREQELPIRYDLMVALIGRASGDKSVEYAREALEICSTIARKNITYRDIRARRKEIDTLVKGLEGEGDAA